MATDSVLKKGSDGYGYKYTELADINAMIERKGESYYQYIETNEINGNDYLFTVKVDKDGNESKPIRGAMLVRGGLSGNKSNPVQDYGTSITYARRYSLLMAYGLATADDDANCFTLTEEEQKEAEAKAREEQLKQPINANMVNTLKSTAKRHKMPEAVLAGKYNKNTLEEITLSDWQSFTKDGKSFLDAWDEENGVVVDAGDK